MKWLILLIVTTASANAKPYSYNTRPCICVPAAPICANDFNTYQGECNMNCASNQRQLYIVYYGRCEDYVPVRPAPSYPYLPSPSPPVPSYPVIPYRPYATGASSSAHAHAHAAAKALGIRSGEPDYSDRSDSEDYSK